MNQPSKGKRKKSLSRYGIYASIEFSPTFGVPSRADNRIGVARENDNGTIDIEIHFWPTNLKQLQLRPFD